MFRRSTVAALSNGIRASEGRWKSGNQIRGSGIDSSRVEDLTSIIKNFRLAGSGCGCSGSGEVKRAKTKEKVMKVPVRGEEGEGLFFSGQSYEQQGGRGIKKEHPKKLRLNISSQRASKLAGSGFKEY